MAGQRYELFTAAKKTIRTHPDWDDAAVAAHVGAKPTELDIIREARKDYAADQQETTSFSAGNRIS